MSVFLFPNRIKDTDFSVTRQVIALLDQHGIHALLADELAGELVDTKAAFLPQQQALAQAKQVITIGGDGTLLRIAHDCLAQSKPVLGVNLGRIGFLATCEVAELPEKLARLAAGRYTIEPRNLLRADAPAHNWHQVAMNDVVLFGNSRLHPMDYTVYCDGAFVSRYRSDGVIIATPTGSTAYSLSAGGPVVEPTASLIVITPICSHALNTSSVVLSAEDDVEVEICEGRYGRQEKVALCYDGAVQRQLVSGDRVKIRKSDAKAHLVKLSEESFMITMREKMKGN